MALGDLFSDANEEAGYKAIKENYRRGQREAAGYLEPGFNQSQHWFRPYARAGRRANRFYADALGLGGEEGNARAGERFEESPGYEFMLETGLDALDRRQAARGMLDSGNTSLDTLQFAEGVADQEWSDYLDRLDAEAARGMQAQGARAGIKTGLADRLATNAMDTWRGIGDAERDYEYSKDASGANILGAITGGLSAVSGFMGGGGGGLSSIFSGGGGGSTGAVTATPSAYTPSTRRGYSDIINPVADPVTYRRGGADVGGPGAYSNVGARGYYY